MGFITTFHHHSIRILAMQIQVVGGLQVFTPEVFEGRFRSHVLDDDAKSSMNEDVSPIENGDFPNVMLVFSGVFFGNGGGDKPTISGWFDSNHWFSLGQFLLEGL